MYFKRLPIAICALAICASCVSLPWRNEPVATEVNLSFTIEKNLVVISSARIQGRAGRFLFGSAESRTVLDTKFAQSLPSGRRALQLGEKVSLPFTAAVTDLHGVADAIIGADVFGRRAVSIDYHAGLLTYQTEGIHPESMTLYRFTGEPKINVEVDGHRYAAIVDTTSPDTLALPRGNEPARRAKAHLVVAGADLGMVDIALGDVTAPRVGNRVLSKFLVTVDYGRRDVGLWRDPRTP